MMYLFYQVALRKHSFFMLNRAYLVLLVLISLCIPLIVIQIPAKPVDQNITALGYNVIIEALENPNSGLSQSYGSGIFILMIYLAGVVFIGIDTVIKYSKAFFFVKKATLNQITGIPYYISSQTDKPFTFFRSIVLPDGIEDLRELESILYHEREHVNQRHWIDNVFLDLVIIFQWFNPLVWVLRSTVKLNHEFLADKAVLKFTSDSNYYYKILLKYALGPKHALAVNFFSKSKLKNRIKMMTTNTTTKLSYFKYFLVIPLVLVLVAVFAEIKPKPVENTTSIMEEKVKISGVVLDAESKEPINNAMVIIKGTNNGTVTNQEGKYIIEAPLNTELLFVMEGRKSVSIVVTGKEISENRDILLDDVLLKRSQEEVDVPAPPPPPPPMEDPPVQEPPVENAQYGIEIIDVDPDYVHLRLVKSIETQEKWDLKPLIIIDGKVTDLEEVESLNSEAIESIGVLKGDSIINVYGIKATDGVIIIKTKK